MQLDRSAFLAIVLTAGLWTTPALSQVIDLGKYPDWSGQWTRILWRPSALRPVKADPQAGSAAQAGIPGALRGKHQGSGRGRRTGSTPPTPACRRACHGRCRASRCWSSCSRRTSPTSCSSAPNFRRAASTPTGATGRKNSEPTFAGYSIGKWLDTDGDGSFDTLEVETRQRARPAHCGTRPACRCADDDEAIIKERISLDKADPDILHDEMTTIDNSLTRPWTVMKTYRRHARHHLVGGQLHRGQQSRHHRQGDLFPQRRRHLMPMKKDQPAPDLRISSR